MKNILFVTFLISGLSTAIYGQIDPATVQTQQHSTAQELQLSPTRTDKNILVISGSTYKKACEQRGSQYVWHTGCANLKQAWRKGQLYNCTNPAGQIPYHEGDEFKCYGTSAGITVEIIQNPNVIGRQTQQQLEN